MTDFKELAQLDYDDSAVYNMRNGDVIQITRVDCMPPVRQWDGLSNTLYDFVNGYSESQEIYNMKTLYESLDNQDLVSIVSASGRDMTADVRLYLSARDYCKHLAAIKASATAQEAQQKIANIYLDHLKAYGDACLVMTTKNLPHVDLDKYGSPDACLRASIDRMESAARGEVYEMRYYRAQDIRRQLDAKCESLKPSYQPSLFAGMQDVARELKANGLAEARFSSIQKQPEPEPEKAEERTEESGREESEQMVDDRQYQDAGHKNSQRDYDER